MKTVRCKNRSFAYRSCLPATVLALCAFALLASCGNPDKNKLKHFNKGMILERRGRPADALVEYQNAFAIDPNMPDLHYQMGKCYIALRYYEQAIKSFDKARQLDPKLNIKALVSIADVYAASDQPALAEAMCRDALLANAGSVDALVLMGKLKLKQENEKEAASWFEKTLSVDPNNVESRLALAQMALDDDRYEVAEKHLMNVTTVGDPKNVTARLALAKIFRFTNRADKSIETLKAILAENPNSFPARGALAEAYYSGNRLTDARREAEAYLKMAPGSVESNSLLGAIILKQGDYASALPYLAKAAGSPSASPQTYYLHGLALKGTNNLGQAISAFQNALALQPKNTPYRLVLAQTLLAEGSFEQAQREIGLVLSDDPGNESARQLLIQADAQRQTFEHIDSLLESQGIPDEVADSFKATLKALRAGDLAKAQKLCEDSLKKVPDSPLFLNLLGLVYLKRQDTGNALRYFNQAVSKNPKFAASYVNMAGVYLGAGSHEQALQLYRKASDLAPKDQMIRLKLAKALILMKRYDEAETVLKELINANPKQIGYRLTLANMFLSANQYSRAREELSRTLKADPKNGHAAYLLAETMAKEGDASRAAVYFHALSRANPSNEEFRTKLALCTLELGHPQKAREFLPASPEKTLRSFRGRLVQALGAASNEDYPNAARFLGEREAETEDVIPHRLLLANVLAAQGKNAEAVDVVNKGAVIPKPFKKNYVKLLDSKSLTKNELYDLDLAIALTEFRWNLLAVARIESVLKKVGQNPALLETAAGILEREGKIDRATADYRSAITADKSYWPAYYRLGVWALRQENMVQAEEYLRNGLKYEPDSVTMLLALAGLYEKKGNVADAVKTYRKIDELHPNLATVDNNLAWLLAKNPKTLDQALGHARAAVTGQPSKAEYLDTLGWIFFQKGDYKNAKEQLEKAVFFNSLSPSIRHHRGLVYLKLGDKTRALEDFKAADALSLPFPERQTNQNMIRELSQKT